MDHITQLYQNRAKVLQEEIIRLESLLEKLDDLDTDKIVRGDYNKSKNTRPEPSASTPGAGVVTVEPESWQPLENMAQATARKLENSEIENQVGDEIANIIANNPWMSTASAAALVHGALPRTGKGLVSYKPGQPAKWSARANKGQGMMTKAKDAIPGSLSGRMGSGWIHGARERVQAGIENAENAAQQQMVVQPQRTLKSTLNKADDLIQQLADYQSTVRPASGDPIVIKLQTKIADAQARAVEQQTASRASRAAFEAIDKPLLQGKDVIGYAKKYLTSPSHLIRGVESLGTDIVADALTQGVLGMAGVPEPVQDWAGTLVGGAAGGMVLGGPPGAIAGTIVAGVAKGAGDIGELGGEALANQILKSRVHTDGLSQEEVIKQANEIKIEAKRRRDAAAKQNNQISPEPIDSNTNQERNNLLQAAMNPSGAPEFNKTLARMRR